MFYDRATDSTQLLPLGDVATSQSKPTQWTMDNLLHLLQYAATHPSAPIKFKRSDMVLRVHSDASYLSAPKARSRAGGYFFLASKSPTDTTINGAIHVEAKIMRNVMASAAEAEIGSLFINAQTTLPLRVALTELGHPQPPTPIQTDNSMASSFAASTVKQKRSKTIDMRYYWLQDRQSQKQIKVYWATKHTNLADYFTKRHSETHHVQIRPFLISNNSNNTNTLSLTDLPKQPEQFKPDAHPTQMPLPVATGKSTTQQPTERVC
jgi:hypothetical protein